MRIAVIICTKDREQDLRRALSSLCGQVYLPAEVIVVDAGTGIDPEPWFNGKFSRAPFRITYLKSEKGLPHQRNRGIEVVDKNTDVISFIDDDVELTPEYYEHVVAAFERTENRVVLGICGNALNETERSRIDRFVRNVFLITDNYSGASLPSGDAGHIFEPKKDSVVAVLSGCNMSFRASVFFSLGLRFDEKLSGYAYMEDQDISLRAARYGELWQLSGARLVHHVSKEGRPNQRELFNMYVQNSFYLFKKNNSPNLFRFVFYFWRLVGKFFHSVIVSFLTLSLAPTRGFVEGFISLFADNRRGLTKTATH